MLYFRTQGDSEENRGRPPLILIHGLFGSLDNLGGIARLLSSSYTVYSLDLPNHGRSPHIAGCNVVLMMREVRRWMNAQGVGSAYILGHSLGGKVAMELALTSPEKVEKLVVLDIAPVTYPPHHQKVFQGLMAISPQGLSSRAEADKVLQEYVPEASVRTFLLKNLIKEDGKFRWRINLEDIHQNYSQINGANCSGTYNGDTLFVKGGGSNYIQEQYREQIAQRFPNTQLKIVSNTGHWLHAEKPGVVAKLVQNFLK